MDLGIWMNLDQEAPAGANPPGKNKGVLSVTIMPLNSIVYLETFPFLSQPMEAKSQARPKRNGKPTLPVAAAHSCAVGVSSSLPG